ncbi:hypothetical protein GF339_11495 [candidate division KSB3 bacterium]|uniref:Transporter n=1 Tax=candidate division KSB3 bacterium TaxID=2044937 RepID=A0A9D5Q6S1_9BACT|nr:hypothetical protein [candidate division KSB3 bacterium]MBD3325201.1 hypothetical protein [candidate division KSB3 bacterium]
MVFRNARLAGLISLLLLGATAFPAPAWNQLPLLTDSPCVLPAGQLQFHVGLQYLSNKNFPFSQFSEDSGRDVLSLPTWGVHLGLGKRAELSLRHEVLFVEEEALLVREQWTSGDLSLFTKIELWRERQRLPGVGLKTGVKLPNASNDYRVGTDETDFAVTALVEKTVSPIIITANLGLLILGNPFENARQDDLLAYGIACSFPWNERIVVSAEIAGQAFGSSHNQRSSAILQTHIRDGALTWHLAGRAGLIENSEDWGLSAGVSLTLDSLTSWAAGK